jgi:hypothetical protein
MEYREWRFVDKSAWDDGLWMSEPDKVQWTDDDTGLPCLAVRHHTSGHWCGYVGVSEGHPWYEAEYDAPDVSCHGGLTFAGHCVESEKEHGVCHIPSPGEPDNVYWFGFDCAHSGDMSPGHSAMLKSWRRDLSYMPEQYRTLRYVQAQVADLAAQIAKEGEHHGSEVDTPAS